MKKNVFAGTASRLMAAALQGQGVRPRDPIGERDAKAYKAQFVSRYSRDVTTSCTYAFASAKGNKYRNHCVSHQAGWARYPDIDVENNAVSSFHSTFDVATGYDEGSKGLQGFHIWGLPSNEAWSREVAGWPSARQVFLRTPSRRQSKDIAPHLGASASSTVKMSHRSV